MTLFRYFLGKPWLYILAGLCLLALMCYSFFDVSRGGSTPPFESLSAYSGRIVNIKELRESSTHQRNDGSEIIVYYYEAEVGLDSGGNKVWRIYVDQPLHVGMPLTAHVVEGKKTVKFYNLVADGALLIDYKEMAKAAAAKAQKENDALTHPVFLSFIGLLIFGGLAGELNERRKRGAAIRQQQA